MPMQDDNEIQQQLIDLLRDAISRDKALREKYEIGDRFRFVRDRLEGLLAQLDAHAVTTRTVVVVEKDIEMAEDEIFVYVYLFNSQGALLQSWVNMLTQKLFTEYSINRPAYLEKTHVENLLRNKANRVQHGYLTVIVKAADILQKPNAQEIADPVIKVREGAFRFERFISLTHDNKEYILTEHGLLVPKVTK